MLDFFVQNNKNMVYEVSDDSTDFDEPVTKPVKKKKTVVSNGIPVKKALKDKVLVLKLIKAQMVKIFW